MVDVVKVACVRMIIFLVLYVCMAALNPTPHTHTHTHTHARARAHAQDMTPEAAAAALEAAARALSPRGLAPANARRISSSSAPTVVMAPVYTTPRSPSAASRYADLGLALRGECNGWHTVGGAGAGVCEKESGEGWGEGCQEEDDEGSATTSTSTATTTTATTTGAVAVTTPATNATPATPATTISSITVADRERPSGSEAALGPPPESGGDPGDGADHDFELVCGGWGLLSLCAGGWS